MKSMDISFHAGVDAPRGGARKVLEHELGGAFFRTHGTCDCWFTKKSSAHISRLVSERMHAGRRQWAQLRITLDYIPLTFWLPEELEHVCAVFREVPFPTALTLAKRDPLEWRLNGHWLSRLPKAAKTQKYRARFVKYVDSAPRELREFRAFYAT